MQAAGQLEDRSRRAVPGPSIGLDKQGADALKRAKQEEYRRQLDQMQPSSTAVQMQDNLYRQQQQQQLNVGGSNPTNGLMLGLDKQEADALKRAKQEEYRRQLDQQQYLQQPPQIQRQFNYYEEQDRYVPPESYDAHDDYAGPTKYMSGGGRGGKDSSSSSSDRTSKRTAAEEYRRDLDRQLEEKRLRTLRDKEAEDAMDALSKPTQDDTSNHRPSKQIDGPVEYIAPYRTAPSDMQHQPFRQEGPIDKDDRFTYAEGSYYGADDNRRGGDYDAHDALRLDVPSVTSQSSNKPTPRKSPVKSPNQARARFIQDIYGGDNLIARVESDTASTTWKPSGRTADVRHKQVILGQKAALDAQIMEVRARKEKEKEDARLEDEKQDLKIREALAIVAEQAKKEKDKVLSVHRVLRCLCHPSLPPSACP